MESKKRLQLIIIGGIYAQLIGLSYIPLLPQIADYHNVPNNIIQLLMTFYLAGFCISQIFSGVIVSLYGYKKSYLIGITISILGIVLIALTNSIISLFSSFIILSFGIGVLIPIHNAFAQHHYIDPINVVTKDLLYKYISIALGIGVIYPVNLGQF